MFGQAGIVLLRSEPQRWGVRRLRTSGLVSIQPFFILRASFYAALLIVYRPGWLPLGGMLLFLSAVFALRQQWRRGRALQAVRWLEGVHGLALLAVLWPGDRAIVWLIASALPLAVHLPWREASFGIAWHVLLGLLFTATSPHGAVAVLGIEPGVAAVVPLSLILVCLGAAVWERRQLSELNVLEPRTGLYHREYVVAQLREACAGNGPLRPPFAVLMFDIDNFKQWNDRFGHQLGDWALAEAARTVRSNLRATDIAGRYGGEEFIILLAGTLEEAAVRVANRLRQALAQRELPGLMPLTASIGVAVYGPGRETAEVLIAAADRALYWAKTHGKNCVASFADLPQLVREELLAKAANGMVVRFRDSSVTGA